MSQKEGSGEGRGGQMSVCGCKEGGERGGSREFKEKATQSVCLCERKGTLLASCGARWTGISWSRKTLHENTSAARGCSRGDTQGREQVLGSSGHS